MSEIVEFLHHSPILSFISLRLLCKCCFSLKVTCSTNPYSCYRWSTSTMVQSPQMVVRHALQDSLITSSLCFSHRIFWVIVSGPGLDFSSSILNNFWCSPISHTQHNIDKEILRHTLQRISAMGSLLLQFSERILFTEGLSFVNVIVTRRLLTKKFDGTAETVFSLTCAKR